MLRTLLLVACVQATVLVVGQTTLYPGDLAVIGVNANNSCIATSADEISFVCFKNITTNTQIYLTDNGYQRQSLGAWGDGEGLFRFQRTGGVIAAGTVITFRVNSATSAPIFVSPDALWSVTVPAGYPAGQWFNLNQGGDQMFFTQGGTWTNPAGANDMTYNGSVLYGFSTISGTNSWVSLLGAAPPTGYTAAQMSGLPGNMVCFSMAPTSTTDFSKFVPWDFVPGPIGARNQRGWIIEIDNPVNWNPYSTCALYNAFDNTAPTSTYSPTWVGATLPFTTGGFTPGKWIGVTTDWFDCHNWDDAEVPTATTPVTITALGSTNSCVIGATGPPPVASCLSLNMVTNGAARTLTIQNGGQLQVAGAVTVGNTVAISGFNGIILGNGLSDGHLTATNLNLSGNGVYKGGFRSEQPGNSADFNGSITINPGGYLDLTGGTVSLTGDYSNNDGVNAFDETGSTIIFNGTGPQSINTSGFQEEFGFLTLSKLSNDLTLNAPISIKSTLTLASGRIMTSNPGGLLTMTNTGTYNLTNPDLSFIHGPMVKVGPVSTHYFPVGKGTYTHGIRLNAITAGPTDAFIAEYFPSDPTVAIGAPFETPPLYGVSTCEYWNLDQYAGAPTGRVSLGWNTNTNCGIVVPSALHVVHWDGTMWRDRGGFAVGTAATGSVTTTAAQETLFAPGGWWTFATITDENTLPIELLMFDARREGSEVRLDWATASERNNDYFTVERSGDAHTFTEVLRVDGAGNSTTTLSYSDYDHWPLPGTSFYRLRQTDFDGATAVSDLVAVKMPGKGGNGLVVLNEPERLIALHDFTVGSRIDVLDMTGRLVWQSRVETEERSFVPIAQLGTGAYVLRVSDDVRAESVPFVR